VSSQLVFKSLKKRKAPALDTAIDVDKYCQNIFTTVGVTKN
jgi:hypothetical protein